MRCGECDNYVGKAFGKCKHRAGSRASKDDLCFVFGLNGKKEGVTGPMFKQKKPVNVHDGLPEEIWP